MQEFILITGGTGYIGSHVCVALVREGYSVILLDNLCNSSANILKQLEKITHSKQKFIQADVCDYALLMQIFSEYKIAAVIHLAGLKSVEESTQKPLEYYHNNVCGTLTLLSAMEKSNIRTFIFSSSATVYAPSKIQPLQEHFLCAAENPYGQSKHVIEKILSDLYLSNPKWQIICLRYFNPIGAHESGLIGENSKTQYNLLPHIVKVALGHQKKLKIFGNDYPTHDGTCVRDYIHVMDLAEGHVAALKFSQNHHHKYLEINLGTGCGYSVLEVVNAFETATNQKIPYEFVARRAGDIAEYWADTSLAAAKLNWKSKRKLSDMCADAWQWQCMNRELLAEDENGTG